MGGRQSWIYAQLQLQFCQMDVMRRFKTLVRECQWKDGRWNLNWFLRKRRKEMLREKNIQASGLEIMKKTSRSYSMAKSQKKQWSESLEMGMVEWWKIRTRLWPWKWSADGWWRSWTMRRSRTWETRHPSVTQFYQGFLIYNLPNVLYFSFLVSTINPPGHDVSVWWEIAIFIFFYLDNQVSLGHLLNGLTPKCPSNSFWLHYAWVLLYTVLITSDLKDCRILQFFSLHSILCMVLWKLSF